MAYGLHDGEHRNEATVHVEHGFRYSMRRGVRCGWIAFDAYAEHGGVTFYQLEGALLVALTFMILFSTPDLRFIPLCKCGFISI